MKRLLIAAALLLASLLPAAAQGAQPWTIHGIAEHWSYEEVPVPEIKGRPGIADFAVAFADKYPGYVLTDEIKNYLTVNGHEGEDVDGFVLDKAAGYLGIDFVSDATVRPLDMTEDGEWVKVSWNGQTGWIDSYWLCANTLTTCA